MLLRSCSWLSKWYKNVWSKHIIKHNSETFFSTTNSPIITHQYGHCTRAFMAKYTERANDLHQAWLDTISTRTKAGSGRTIDLLWTIGKLFPRLCSQLWHSTQFNRHFRANNFYNASKWIRCVYEMPHPPRPQQGHLGQGHTMINVDCNQNAWPKAHANQV